jgi:glucose-6-phosphate 1-dehydrogenase
LEPEKKGKNEKAKVTPERRLSTLASELLMADQNVMTQLRTEEPARHRVPAPCAMVIFGASGDLTERKLVPALYYLYRAKLLPEGFSVIGCAKTPFSNDEFREKMRNAVEKYLSVPAEDAELLEGFLRKISYLSGDFGSAQAYCTLKNNLNQLDQQRGTDGNRLFYLATPPSVFPVIVSCLGEAGLAETKDGAKSWTRIVIEKPFGRDLASARELNRIVTDVFKEDQIYRIDHYLGKETVQNLLVFRFGNGIFEPFWNRRYIDHVQIAVAEELGIDNRGSYYEEAGLVRDMIQNHALSLLSLVTMEPPAIFDATAVRDEKSKVMRAVRPIPPGHAQEFAVRGQYVEGWPNGQRLPAYRAEPKVSPQSTTETFAALKLFIDNWRWADVPFYLRSGKRLPKRVTEISVRFRRAPHLLFKGTGTTSIEPNLLSIHIQPDEGMSLMFNAKIPGTTMQIRPVTMNFHYEEAFGQAPPTTAYETLLLDCMLGDAMLFTRADFVDLAWELLGPVLNRWQEDGRKGLSFYEAGTWGPPEADAFIERDGRKWQEL